VIPLLAEEGWRDSAGVVSSARHFGPTDHTVCAFATLGASTPPQRGGEYVLNHTTFISIAVTPLANL